MAPLCTSGSSIPDPEEEIPMADVVLDKITKRYENGFEAVKELSLDIANEEFLVLVGPSGCGKSTALRMVAGLESISEGELRIGGQRVNEKPSRDRDIAMVFQSYALYPHMSVADNIAFGLKLRKMPKEEIKRRIDSAAKTLGLEELMDRRPKMLSGGQRQRVAMGRAIVRNPQAFLMDEPLSNLDAKLRVQMRADIAALQHDLGVTTIYVTHDQVEAMTMGDRVAVMRKGLLQQADDPQVLYDFPDNIFVAGFIGSPPMNMCESSLLSDNGNLVVQLGDQRLTVDPEAVTERPALRNYVNQTVGVGVRSEDLSQPGPRNDVPEDRRLKSTAMLTEALGSEIVVHFEVPAPSVNTEETKELAKDAHSAEGIGSAEATVAGTKFVASFSPRSRVRPGDPIEVGVDTSRLHFFDLETGLSIRS
jgi:multiple sugar transport system ATP-binding protein